MACCQIGNKPSPKPMMTHITDWCISIGEMGHHWFRYVSPSRNEFNCGVKLDVSGLEVSTRLWYLHCLSAGVATVLGWAINLFFFPSKQYGCQQQDRYQRLPISTGPGLQAGTLTRPRWGLRRGFRAWENNTPEGSVLLSERKVGFTNERRGQ